jgi:hypothetical protein
MTEPPPDVVAPEHRWIWASLIGVMTLLLVTSVRTHGTIATWSRRR